MSSPLPHPNDVALDDADGSAGGFNGVESDNGQDEPVFASATGNEMNVPHAYVIVEASATWIPNIEPITVRTVDEGKIIGRAVEGLIEANGDLVYRVYGEIIDTIPWGVDDFGYDLVAAIWDWETEEPHERVGTDIGAWLYPTQADSVTVTASVTGSFLSPPNHTHNGGPIYSVLTAGETMTIFDGGLGSNRFTYKNAQLSDDWGDIVLDSDIPSSPYYDGTIVGPVREPQNAGRYRFELWDSPALDDQFLTIGQPVNPKEADTKLEIKFSAHLVLGDTFSYVSIASLDWRWRFHMTADFEKEWLTQHDVGGDVKETGRSLHRQSPSQISVDQWLPSSGSQTVEA